MGIHSVMYNGLSGIGVMGENMSVLADNIANVNTTAYKGSRGTFEDMLHRAVGGTNGDGVRVSSVDTDFKIGGLQTTKVGTDMAIEGKGFFVLSDPAKGDTYYTRDGQFMIREDTASSDIVSLVSKYGYDLQGYDLRSSTAATTLGAVEINLVSAGKTTEALRVALNLQDTGVVESTSQPLYSNWDGTKVSAVTGRPDPIATTDYAFSMKQAIFDDQGDSYDLSIYFDNTENLNEMEFLVTCDPSKDRRLIDGSTSRYNDTGAPTNKGAGALMYGVLQFSTAGDLQNIDCWQVPGDGAVDHGAATNQLQLSRGEAFYSFGFNFSGAGDELTSTLNFGTIAQPQSVSSVGAAVLSTPDESPRPIASTSYWSEVYDAAGLSPLSGDVLSFAGIAGDGTAVNYSYSIDPGHQISALLAGLGSAFGASATVEEGRIILTDQEIGDSQLTISSISYRDAAGNAPAANSSLAQVFGDEGSVFLTSQQERYQIDIMTTTNYASQSAVFMRQQDGFGQGYLEGVRVDADGVIYGQYSNNLEQQQAQVGLATFVNEEGLSRTGGNLYVSGPDAGEVTVGAPGENGRGGIAGGSLEEANVDLSRQFTELITTQRYYQANAKSISTADEVYELLTSMVR